MTVQKKQHILAYLGYYKGAVDGIWGSLSQKATEELQAASGLSEDGDFGDATLAAAKYAVANDLFKQEVDDSKVSNSGTFWDHIRYWTREEFRCRCWEYHDPYCNGFPVEPNQTLVELADDVRTHFGRPGHRSSGIRCPWHNRDSEGVANSKHLEGKALDFFIEGISGEELLAYVQSDPRTNYAYIINPGEPYVHMDVA